MYKLLRNIFNFFVCTMFESSMHFAFTAYQVAKVLDNTALLCLHIKADQSQVVAMELAGTW